MNTAKTVDQIIRVLRYSRQNFVPGRDVSHAYQDGIRRVAREDAVAYQTIGDACRRRLRLQDVSEFRRLLEGWLQGDGLPLQQRLLETSDPRTHLQIRQFFKEGPQESSRTAPLMAPEAHHESFSFRLVESDARALRALAELQAIPAADLAARLVGAAVREEMKRVAEEFGS